MLVFIISFILARFVVIKFIFLCFLLDYFDPGSSFIFFGILQLALNIPIFVSETVMTNPPSFLEINLLIEALISLKSEKFLEKYFTSSYFIAW